MHVELQRTYRRLLAGLAFFELVHVLGLLTMVGVLLPGLSPASPVAARAAYVQGHPWSWRLGWLPWQLCAVSDIWVGLALLAWTRRLGAVGARAQRWAWLGAALLLIAVVPEQYAEARLVSDFPIRTASLQWYSQLKLYMWLTGTWANTAYTLMTGCWLLAAHAVARQSALSASARWTRVAEGLVLLVFALAGVANHYAFGGGGGEESQPAFALASACNGVAFVGLLLLVLSIAHRAGAVQLQAIAGRAAQRGLPAWPVADSLPGRALATIAGSPGIRDLLRAVQRLVPFPELRSDIRDVLYLNWLVPADALEALLPGSIRVQRYGELAVLSLLVYRHGHFGPACLGPLRVLTPSPVQCNLRVYPDASPGHVVFVSNSIDHGLYFVGTRLLSDGLPAHCAASCRAERSGSRLEFTIDHGAGSALGLRAELEETSEAILPVPFASAFGDYTAALSAIIPQNIAVRALPTIGRWCSSRIVVDAAIADARPARLLAPVEIGPPFAELIADAPLLAFVLPAVRFVVFGESWAETADPTPA